MAGLELKEYQRESLEAIGRFCDQEFLKLKIYALHQSKYALVG